MNHTESLFTITTLLMALKYPQHLDAMLIIATVLFITNILLYAYKAYLLWKIQKLKGNGV